MDDQRARSYATSEAPEVMNRLFGAGSDAARRTIVAALEEAFKAGYKLGWGPTMPPAH